MTLYYDLLNHPSPGFPWRTVLIILFALAFGAMLYAYTVISEDPTYKNKKFLAFFILGGVILIEGSAFWSKKGAQNECLSWRRNGIYQITEGRVTHFKSDPSQGHKWETFQVNAQPFQIDLSSKRCGFHQTQYWGGPITEGKQVRIYHNEGYILRLEISQ